MISFDDLDRFLRPLKFRLYRIVGKALLTAIGNSKKTQTVQIKMFGDAVYDDIERFQEYGLETYPDASDENCEVAILDLGGLNLAICVHNREERPKDLATGEVCLYSKHKQRIKLKSDGSVEITTDNKPVKIIGSQITLEGSTINLKNSGGDPVMLETIINKFNTHTHLYNPGAGGATPSGAPSTTFVAGTDSAANVKAKTG